MLPLVVALFLSAGVCKVDDDCALRIRCTCDCCHPLEAMTKAEAESERRRCMAVGPCSPKEPCVEKCPREKPVVAACRDGRCVKQAKAAADAGR